MMITFYIAFNHFVASYLHTDVDHLPIRHSFYHRPAKVNHSHLPANEISL